MRMSDKRRILLKAIYVVPSDKSFNKFSQQFLIKLNHAILVYGLISISHPCYKRDITQKTSWFQEMRKIVPEAVVGSMGM